METRQADLIVFTLHLGKKIVPAGVTLEDFRIGAGHEGLLPRRCCLIPLRRRSAFQFGARDRAAGL
jgi:hypothetical protein